MKRAPLVAVVALFAIGCEAPTATRPAYAFNPTSLSNGLLYRWAQGAEIRVWAQPDPASSYDLQAALHRAIDAWNDVRAFDEYTLVAASSIHDANVVVYDRAVANPVRPGECAFSTGGSGFTYFCPSETAPGAVERLQLVEGGQSNVSMVVSLDRGRVSTQAAYDAVMVHELGHVLGIGGHSDTNTDVMFGLPTNSVPTSRDRRTLYYVLGQPASLVVR